MNAKEKRFSAIKNILRTEIVRSQDELQRLLTDRGFEVTQGTISRDLRQMKIVKTLDHEECNVYILPEIILKEASLLTLQFDESTIEFSGNLAVIKTRPGYAMGIASDIDKHASDEILGTIAGDDTILVIPREGFTKTQVKEVLTQVLKDKDSSN